MFMMVHFAAASCTQLLLQICYISENKEWREEESTFLKQQRKYLRVQTLHTILECQAPS